MEMKLVFILGALLLAGLAMAKPEEFSDFEESAEIQNDEPAKKEETASNDEPKVIMEDMNTETSTSLDVQNDPDAIKNKGLCHLGVGIWTKVGSSHRCNCMRCTCRSGGVWACAFEFRFCPYYYCGNQIYNPNTQVCCCGKAHLKRRFAACCGYFLYNTRVNKCCNYFSVKPRSASCPRHKL